jgi:hypothetical protein
MLRLIRKIFRGTIFLVPLFLSFDVYAQCKDVKKYYTGIWKAQECLLNNDFKGAIKFYKKSLLLDQNLFFETDLINGAFCASKLNDTAFFSFCKRKFNSFPLNRKIDIQFPSGKIFNAKDSLELYSSRLDKILDSLLRIDQSVRLSKYSNGKPLYCIDNKAEILHIDSCNYNFLIKNIFLLENEKLCLYSQKKMDVLMIHFLQWGYSGILDSIKHFVLKGNIDNRAYSQWCDGIINNFPLHYGYMYQYDGYFGTKNAFLIGDYAIYYFNHQRDKKIATIRRINKNRKNIFLNSSRDHFKSVAYCYLKLNEYFYYNNYVEVFNFGSLQEDNNQAEENIKNSTKQGFRTVVYKKR